VTQSVSRKGECRDNAVAESFSSTIKRELAMTGPGRPGPGGSVPSLTTSRAGTTPAGSTAPSATSAPPNTS
jgi:transposase InsO family protein